MATFKGKAGIEALIRKVEAQSKVLVMATEVGLTHHLIEESPVGIELYPSRIGFVQNTPGDFKNSWAVGNGSENRVVRGPDASGSDAYVSAITDALKYDFEETVYVTNCVPHADLVEDGWNTMNDPSRGFRGWEDRDGYHVVAKAEADVGRILQDAIKKAQNAKGVDI